MTSVCLALIQQLNAGVFTLLAILFVAFWVVYRLGLFIAKLSQQDGKIDKLENLAEKVIVLSTKVDLIYDNTNPRRTFAPGSPFALTPIGKDISIAIKAEELLAKNFDRLQKFIEESAPKNAYDIQMAAMKVAKEKLLDLLIETELIAVKQEAYNRGLLVEDILSVVGILLRDRILTLKGIPISDVDKHAKPPIP